RYTSFVVVDTRTGDRRVRDAAEARAVPVAAPAGWAMTRAPQLQQMYLGAPPGGANVNMTRAGGYGGVPMPVAAAAPMAPMAMRGGPPAPAPAFAPPPAPQAAVP